MIPVLKKLSGLYSWYILVILTLGYLTAELGHFLVGVTSKSTAADVPYGDIACMLKEEILEAHFNLTYQFACESAMNQTRYQCLPEIFFSKLRTITLFELKKPTDWEWGHKFT